MKFIKKNIESWIKNKKLLRLKLIDLKIMEVYKIKLRILKDS